VRIPDDVPDGPGGTRAWGYDAVVYRIEVRSFADTTADGVGDLDGLRARAGYFELLGVDAIWLTTLLRGPITEPQGRDIDPLIGDLESFRMLVAEANAAGIRVAIDLPVDERHLSRPGAPEELGRTLRFWLDMGVYGVRIGTPSHMGEAADESIRSILRVVRPIVDEYPDRLVGALVDDEWFTLPGAELLDVPVDLRLGDARFDADEVRDVITRVRASATGTGKPPVWVLADRRQVRPVTRYGAGPLGVARARAMALVAFALPGVVGVDYGEELGLPDADMPGRVSQDPVRGPMPWEGTAPPFGFSSAPGTWWPVPEEWTSSTVEAQLEDEDSTLSLYRRAIQLRQEHPAVRGTSIEWFGSPAGCFAFRRPEGRLTCALNTSPKPVPLPPGEVLLSSGPLLGHLPKDTAVWLVPD
jgi:alpha-glucosidase